ncbi:DUF192 domain-containing protein [Patescibacteria group bacterium]|nr:DUF192 domain-containing protein [Patescibacteria group bacterium]MCL5091273.1 DUF192 domain-containing protein [Patescibacteria group bacterium]
MVVVAAATLVIINRKAPSRVSKTGTTIGYNLNGRLLRLLVADQPAAWEKGLMFVKQKDGFDGMLFVFPDKDYRSFWNKNTLVDLELYWLDDDRVVGKDFLPAVTKGGLVTLTSPAPANRVIELVK